MPKCEVKIGFLISSLTNCVFLMLCVPSVPLINVLTPMLLPTSKESPVIKDTFQHFGLQQTFLWVSVLAVGNPRHGLEVSILLSKRFC